MTISRVAAVHSSIDSSEMADDNEEARKSVCGSERQVPYLLMVLVVVEVSVVW
jgi:hypothetical protein